jgi:NAD(P)H-dependent FMN reductase/N-acetylglutamate synthase-like GNAT family acetyltransferase
VSARILLVTGSTRSASTNTAALRAAHEDSAQDTELYEGLAALPAFSPDDDAEGALPDVVAALRRAIAGADGVLFCTPEYAGELPGSFKNLLDWTVGGAEMYGKPVAWVTVAAPGRGLKAEAALRTVLGYVGAVILEPAGMRIVVERSAVRDGDVVDADVRRRIAGAVGAFAAALGAHRAAPDGGTGIEEHAGPRDELRHLFVLADDSETELDAYIGLGRVLVATEGGRAVGHLQLTETGRPGELEIRNTAVLDSHRRRGIGTRLIDAALDLARAEGGATVVVATAAAGLDALRFYQRAGFRMRSIERDAFTPERGYPAETLIDGIELRDRVWLDRDVGPRPT